MNLFSDPVPNDPSGHAAAAAVSAASPRAAAMAWPEELLEHFCLRMSFRGMCVSRALMLCDRRYALEQLVHAHDMADERLQHMAGQLFRHFEAQQSGIHSMH